MSERPSTRPSSRPVAIDVPTPAADRPSWAKVGIVAAVGFVVGVAWPKALGVRLGPSAPGATVPSAEPVTDEKKPEVKATASTVSAPIAAASSTAAPPPVEVPVFVRRGNVLACKTADGSVLKGKECGTLSLDDQAIPKIRTLGKCPQAAGVTGKLSLVFTIDFDKGRTNFVPGRSSTVKNLDGLSECLRTSMESLKMKGIRHDHPSYTVAYNAVFGADEHAKEGLGGGEAQKPAPREGKDGGTKSEAPGMAEVAWDSVIRDAPKTGAIVGHLPKGAKVKAGASREGWYNVHFGDGFTQEGWIHHGAIGR